MATWKIKEGDSLWLDIITDTAEITAIDSVWTNFLGTWEIKAALADASPVASGSLTQTATVGTFRFNLSTTDSETLTAGVGYFLVFEINNTTKDYREELQGRLLVEAQGILP